MEKILTVKPWIILLSLIILSIFSETIFGKILYCIWFLLFIYWTLGIGKSLFEKLKDKSILNLKRFQTQIFFAVIYMIVILIFSKKGYEINVENFTEYGWKVFIIIPLHLFFMYSIIHSIYFLSKCITTLRNKKEGFGWYMIGFWFFPIGIFIIQPRIIKLLNND